MSVPDPDSRGWARLGKRHALEAARLFGVAQENADPISREADLRAAQKAVNIANYCVHQAAGELIRESGKVRGHRIAVQLHEPLTAREMEVAQRLTTGGSNREIGESMFISEGTVKTHVQHILAKLGVGRREEVVVWAVRNLPEWVEPASENGSEQQT